MAATTAPTEAEVRQEVAQFLVRNFPQIAMHGGDAAIEALDLETGELWIQLGGACSGCGISPMTIQAIQHRLVREVDAIETVYADAGFGGQPGVAARGRDGGVSDAPF